MKKYRLKQWYPSLYEDITEGTEIEYKDGWIYYVNTRGNKTTMEFDSYEFKFTAFWELIEEKKYCNCPIPAQLPGGLLCFKCQQFIRKEKEPLFTTEDGVEMFVGDSYIIVEEDFKKHRLIAHNLPYTEDFKKFKHESNADEYVVWHKKWLSVNDLLLADIGITTNQLDKLHQMAIKKNIING